MGCLPRARGGTASRGSVVSNDVAGGGPIVVCRATVWATSGGPYGASEWFPEWFSRVVVLSVCQEVDQSGCPEVDQRG